MGVDEDAEMPSGCSIDALVNRLRALGTEMGVTLIDHAPVWYRDGDAIRSVPRPEFRCMAGEGGVGPETHVFDTTITRLRTLRGAGLEQPASGTWHGRAFFRDVPAG